jgi:hypothetical protein
MNRPLCGQYDGLAVKDGGQRARASHPDGDELSVIKRVLCASPHAHGCDGPILVRGVIGLGSGLIVAWSNQFF